VHLTASPVSVEEDQIIVQAALELEGKVRANMTADWRRFRPR
jgi:hypothetical protein